MGISLSEQICQAVCCCGKPNPRCIVVRSGPARPGPVARAEWAGAATADAESNVGEAWVSMGMNVFVHPGVSHPVVCPRGWEWVVGLPGGVMDEL